MLSVNGLHAYYGRAHILQGVSLEVRAGEVVALLGRNGAGKSTTIKAIMGLVPPAQGKVSFGGARIERLPSYRIARLGVGYVPEDRRIFSELTVMENLEVGRQPARAGAPAWSETKLFSLFPNLGRMRERPGGRMSGGEQQMLTIARTLMGNPALRAARRAVGRPGARRRRADGAIDPGAQGGRGWRSCSPNRTCISARR
jgi:branched-chain amino acid transport system ATP-binding protein